MISSRQAEPTVYVGGVYRAEGKLHQDLTPLQGWRQGVAVHGQCLYRLART